MMRTEENTMIPLAAVRDDIVVRRIGRRVQMASSLQMNCAVLHKPNNEACEIVSVAGNVDSTTSDQLLAKVELLLGADHASHVILDLEGVARIDSSGVGALLTALQDSQRHGVRFTLCGLPKPLYTTLARMHLASLFEIRTTLEEAFER